MICTVEIAVAEYPSPLAVREPVAGSVAEVSVNWSVDSGVSRLGNTGKGRHSGTAASGSSVRSFEDSGHNVADAKTSAHPTVANAWKSSGRSWN